MPTFNQSEEFAELGKMPVSAQLKLPCDISINGGRVTIPKGATFETLMNVFSILDDAYLPDHEHEALPEWTLNSKVNYYNLNGLSVPRTTKTDWVSGGKL
jgi:hypothetical protein